jgi:hypothetical protein
MASPAALPSAVCVLMTALLTVVGPGAIAAAVAAEKEVVQRRDQVRDALKRDLEAARYAADRAFRQYDAADPANRLVAGELEARWNKALARVAEAEGRIAAHDATMHTDVVDPPALATIAEDLKTVWTARQARYRRSWRRGPLWRRTRGRCQNEHARERRA